MQLFPPYILPVFNVYRYAIDCASRVLQLYASRAVIYSAHASLNGISSDRVLLFTFLLMARKLYLVIFCRELKSCSLFNRNLSEFLCTVLMSHRYHNLRLQCSTLLYYQKMVCAPFHSYWSNGVYLSYNLEFSAKIPVTQIVRIKIAH